MALVLADRVQQTGTANTTVSFTLSGSVTGFQSFAVIGNGNATYYSALTPRQARRLPVPRCFLPATREAR
jgi:hypothetical protein